LTPPRPKALISWSSGKDSAFALHEVRRSGEFDVVGALTSVTETFGRVSIHGVRQEILRAQCEAAGLPSRIVQIPYPCPNQVYEARMGEAVATAVRDGITHMIFGDLFLADVRAYREAKLAGTGITPVFPLHSMRNCWRTCRRGSIPAARMASFIPAWWRGRFFRDGFP
jgi:diphthamide synthase (EF-2-diphthine--ammonia ligase)